METVGEKGKEDGTWQSIWDIGAVVSASDIYRDGNGGSIV